ncbi:response regulator transcription factor [Perlabentimonas gracilis]|uniref:response regulator transcription factor n=1 Tax=Perlabentimonas gracilis TaxID=2715279 RepID=UPI0014098718|nr:response regulator transcription factor [Perlabentimonas gracilis]NHB69871.1 response regulator transcription factor [Perlabentimonas gracilis]
MIRLAVVDKVIKKKGYTIHRVKDQGLVKSVESTGYDQETINQRDEDDQMVVVFNINLKGEEGKALIEQIDKQQAKVCLYLSTEETTQEQPKDLDGILASADWILLNDSQRNTLVDEIDHVLNKGKRINPKVASRIIQFITQPKFRYWDSAKELTNREAEIMNLLIDGLADKEIASKLGISLQTVKSHLKHIYAKLGVCNRVEAMLVYTKINGNDLSAD